MFWDCKNIRNIQKESELHQHTTGFYKAPVPNTVCKKNSHKQSHSFSVDLQLPGLNLELSVKQTPKAAAVILHVSEKNLFYLIFSNLKKAEPVFVILACYILLILASKSIYNFTSNRTVTYLTLQFSHLTAMYLNMPLNKEDNLLIKVCVLKVYTARKLPKEFPGFQVRSWNERSLRRLQK